MIFHLFPLSQPKAKRNCLPATPPRLTNRRTPSPRRQPPLRPLIQPLLRPLIQPLLRLLTHSLPPRDPWIRSRLQFSRKLPNSSHSGHSKFDTAPDPELSELTRNRRCVLESLIYPQSKPIFGCHTLHPQTGHPIIAQFS